MPLYDQFAPPIFPTLQRKLSLLEPQPPQHAMPLFDNREQPNDGWMFDPRQSNTGQGWMDRSGPPQAGSFLYNPQSQTNTPSPYWNMPPGTYYGGSDTDNNMAQRNAMNVGMGFDDIPSAYARAIMDRPYEPEQPRQTQPDIWIRGQSPSLRADPIADLINSLRPPR